MKKIIVDMDDVITKTDYFIELEKYAGRTLDRSYKGFHLEDLLGERKKEFFDHFDEINFYNYATLMDDCYSVLKELSSKYQIYICSTFTWKDALEKSSYHLKNKYDYLYKNLPFIDPNNYIFMTNKNLIRTDVRIDDKIENLKNGRIKLLYTAWHNMDYSDEYLKKKNIIRVNNWQDIRRILLVGEEDENRDNI